MSCEQVYFLAGIFQEKQQVTICFLCVPFNRLSTDFPYCFPLALRLQFSPVMNEDDTASKKNILVIDPDEDFSRNVRLFLEDNYRVIARQELEYIDYTIRLHRIDLLLIEAEYAGSDALSLINHLKASHRNLKIIIMYTYFSADKVTEKNLADCTDDMITKPFDVGLLKEKVDKLLQSNRSQVSHA